jgi:hypothetical protein
MSKEPEGKSIPKTEHASSASASANAAPHTPFNPFSTAAWDPMAAFSASQQAWQKMMGDSVSRAQSWADEYAEIERQMYSRALQAVDTWAQLARDTISYSQQLTTQARKLGIETLKKSGIAVGV